MFKIFEVLILSRNVMQKIQKVKGGVTTYVYCVTINSD